jgi:hypothetical protein
MNGACAPVESHLPVLDHRALSLILSYSLRKCASYSCWSIKMFRTYVWVIALRALSFEQPRKHKIISMSTDTRLCGFTFFLNVNRRTRHCVPLGKAGFMQSTPLRENSVKSWPACATGRELFNTLAPTMNHKLGVLVTRALHSRGLMFCGMYSDAGSHVQRTPCCAIGDQIYIMYYFYGYHKSRQDRRVDDLHLSFQTDLRVATSLKIQPSFPHNVTKRQ